MVEAAPPDHSDGPGSELSLSNQSCVSPDNNTSHLMLSISTIASAIADASISTDPSQLAAMIMELSKRGRMRNRPETAGPAVNCEEEPLLAQHVRALFPNITPTFTIVCFGHMTLSSPFIF